MGVDYNYKLLVVEIAIQIVSTSVGSVFTASLHNANNLISGIAGSIIGIGIEIDILYCIICINRMLEHVLVEHNSSLQQLFRHMLISDFTAHLNKSMDLNNLSICCLLDSFFLNDTLYRSRSASFSSPWKYSLCAFKIDLVENL